MAYQQWCFTINNPNDYRPAFKPDDMAFMCYGIERGEQNGTEHIQGYVRFLTRRRFNTAKRIIGGDHQCEPHVEHCKGTELQNREYCFKQDGEHFQQGEFQPDFGMQGRRSDLDDLAQAALSGTSLRDIATRFPTSFIRYHRGIQSLIETTAPMPALERQVEVLILWGPTGTGKTHRTLHAWPTIYGAKPGRDPWGSYRGEKEILFDEFDHELWPITAMNRYLDKWRCLLDARYNDRYAAWERVVICANSNPQSWYPSAAPLLLDAFRRRIRGHCFYVDSQDPSLEALQQQEPTPL